MNCGLIKHWHFPTISSSLIRIYVCFALVDKTQDHFSYRSLRCLATSNLWAYFNGSIRRRHAAITCISVVDNANETDFERCIRNGKGVLKDWSERLTREGHQTHREDGLLGELLVVTGS